MSDFRALCPDTLLALEQAMYYAVRGDYYEFGLYNGYTLWYASEHSQQHDMHFHGFDCFTGLPEDDGEFHMGDYACPRSTLERNLTSRGADWSRIHLIEGLFSSLTSPHAQMRPAAVVLIDCDLYSSTRDALRFITPLLQTGTILLLDDYNCANGGERRAFQERTFDAMPLSSFGWHGEGFTVKLDG